MSHTKLIHWANQADAEGKVHCSLVYMIGYCPSTIGQFTEMAKEVIKDFPGLDVNKFEGGKVFKSNWCQGHTLVVWYGYLEKREYAGWLPTETGVPTQLTEYWY